MPVEIKELIIRAVASSAGGGGEAMPERDGCAAEAEKASIVAACVREVMSILRRAKER
ncbi:MAG: hypothetical protein GY856_42575 [bacterium]|nr:hypothetical protein [bacterium]